LIVEAWTLSIQIDDGLIELDKGSHASFIGVKCHLDVLDRARERLYQHECADERETCALARERRCAMRGIARQYHTADRPARKMNLCEIAVVELRCCRNGRDQPRQIAAQPRTARGDQCFLRGHIAAIDGRTCEADSDAKLACIKARLNHHANSVFAVHQLEFAKSDDIRRREQRKRDAERVEVLISVLD
jgi:hypothetical protein